jgi:hypothetical protein
LTKTEEQTEPAVTFFEEVIVPVAEQRRAEGKSFFLLGPDAEAETYFVEPSRSVMRPADFELGATESTQSFVEELSARWIQEGNEELAAMAPRLAELASEFAAQDEPAEEDLYLSCTQCSDVSPDDESDDV